MSNNPADILNTHIELCKSFEEISKWREAWFKVYQNSGDKFKGIVSDIYSGPTHFMFELLQNADDAKATKVRFEIRSDKIVFYHNGTRDFSLQDIISITGIGNSTKTETEQSIGKFGIGFKAVFVITKTPKIWSKKYNFKIENLSVPYKIEAAELGEWTTIFELEYESDKYSTDDIYQRLLGETKNLDIQTILFLRHIRELEVDADNNRVINLGRGQRDGYTEFSDPADESKYLVFRGGHNNRTNIAYRLDAVGNITEPRNANVSVYFPTQIKSFLGFVVNAPFSTPRTRETIDFSYSYNPDLVSEVKAVFRASILKLRDLGLWSPDMIQEIMPINSTLREQSQMYGYLYDALTDAFKQEKLVPVKGSRYALADMTIIAADNSIAKLLDHKDKKWATISGNHTLLRMFYRDALDIPIVRFQDFIKLCTPNYLKKQKTNWLYQFYSYCSEQLDKEYRDETRKFLKQQPIIKSRSGNFTAAYVDESQNIFLNSTGLGNARIVDKMFTTKAKGIQQETRYKLENLLDKLEVKSRSPKSTIELDIMRKWEKADFNMRKKAFFEMVEIYNKSNKDEKEDIAKYLYDKNVLYTASGEWLNDNVYQDIANLHLLFDGAYKASYIHPDFWVVDYREREIIQKDGEKKLVIECRGSNELLGALGVCKGLRVRRGEYGAFPNRPVPDVNILKQYGVPSPSGARRVEFTYEIHDFDEILKNIDSPEKSSALVDELLAIPDDKYSGEISWYTSPKANYRASAHSIPAQFILELSDEKWIIDKDGRRRAPGEVFEDDFRELYGINKAEKLPGLIDLKPSVRKSLPPEEQEKLALADNFTLEELKEFKRQKDAEKDHENKPEFELEDDTRSIVLDESKDIVESETESSHSEVRFNKEPHESAEYAPAVRERKEKVTIKKTDNTKQMIGDYGESKVLENLRNQHSNATDIPNGFLSGGKKFLLLGNTNPGYDIEVSKGGEIIEYIEVKTRTAVSSSVVITRTEWEYAKKFGDKYTIYIVSVMSDDKAQPLFHKYNDPYSQYIEGKISLMPDSYRLA